MSLGIVTSWMLLVKSHAKANQVRTEMIQKILHTLIIATSLILTGCGSTGAQKEHDAYAQKTSEEATKGIECLKATHEAFRPEIHKQFDAIGLGFVRPGLEEKSNKNQLTPQQKQLGYAYWSQVHGCINDAVARTMPFSANEAIIMQENFSAIEEIRLALLQDKISIGEYVTRYDELHFGGIERLRSKRKEIDLEYAQKHADELAERRRMWTTIAVGMLAAGAVSAQQQYQSNLIQPQPQNVQINPITCTPMPFTNTITCR